MRCATRLLALSAAVLFAGSLIARPGNSQPFPLVIQLKWYDQFQFAGYYAAQHMGYYQQAGLEVTLRPGGKGIDPVEEVLSGRAQLGIGDADLLLARAKGKPVVVLAAIFQHSPYIILTREDSNLHRPSDLVGKTILSMGDQGSTQILGMLLNEGIDPARVRILPHTWNLDDLASKRVDGMSAYSTVEPYQLQQRGIAPSAIRPGDYGIDFYGDCLFTTESELETHPEEIKAFLEATQGGWQVAMDDPQRVIPWILERPGVRRRGISQEALAYEANAMQPLVLSNIVPVGHMNPLRWEQILATYKKLGLIPPSANLNGFLYTPSPERIHHLPRWTWIAFLGLAGLFLLASLWVLSLRRAVRSRTEELRREQAQLLLMQHSADQAQDFMTWVGEDGHYLYANHAVLELYGLTLEQLQQQRIWNQIPSLDESQWRLAWKALLKHGSLSRDLSLKGKDGVEVPVESLSTLVDTGGRLICCNIARDLTEFRKAEAERKEKEQQLALILESTGVGIWDWRVSTGVLEMDATVDRILGVEPFEFPRTISAWMEHLHPEDREATLRSIRAVLGGSQGIYDTEYRLRRKNGSWVWVHVRGRAVAFTTDGKAERILGVFQDIDDRRRGEEDRLQSQRLEGLGLLAGGIAHDFNNLLTAVVGNLNLARLKLQKESKEAAYLEKAEEAVQRAAKLTHQLLAYSGKGRLIVGAIDLNEMVVQMRELVAISFPKDLVVETALDPDSPFLEGDATQIQQVVLNLLTNASEAIGSQPGVLRLETSVTHLTEPQKMDFPLQEPLPPGGYAVLRVSDSGVGMEPEVKARIFDPFFTTKATGRGLGLSAILGIMRGHQGGIELSSSTGRGTTFALYFPLRTGSPLPKEVLTPSASPALEGGAVLLADDEPGVLEAGQELLEAMGFTVLTAEDGEAAITTLLENMGRIHLVILDQTMPRMSGTDTFRAIRRLQPGLPVILSSGYSEEEVGEVLRQEGLDGFLQKPYRLADLEAVVRKVLGL